MATAPYGVRLLVGAAVSALEETRKLPQTVLMYPMSVVSAVAQAVMKMQQDLADLAIKGDSALENLFPPTAEQPEWATFDEDSADSSDPGPSTNGERRTDGRFALYSVTDDPDADDLGAGPVIPPAAKSATKPRTAKPRAVKKVTKKATPTAGPDAGSTTNDKPAPAAPSVAVDLDYDSLTLAQVRARMTALSVADLRALLAYEEAGKARAPFQTLLANRITRATAK